MDIKFILNDVLNKALINKGRIKGIPSSDKIGDFVNKYVENELLAQNCPLCNKEMESQLVKHHHCKDCREHYTS
jgi:hypothetical protein